MNLAEANLIQVPPEKPFVMLRWCRDSVERGVLGSEGKTKGNCISEGYTHCGGAVVTFGGASLCFPVVKQ